LISIPGDKTPLQAWEQVNAATSKNQPLSTNWKFPIPDLKVGTLDQLVGLSDDLGKLDSFVEGITRKIAAYLREVLENQRDKVAENLLANNLDLVSYVTKYQWDMARYPLKQSLRILSEIIGKQVGQIDADLKIKSQSYNNLKGSLQNLEKKQVGSLITRNLADLVKKEHFVLDSEYLVTLIVVVQKSQFNDWQLKYEKLTTMVVPRSSNLIFQDQEHGLFTVTLFRKVVDEFKYHCRENKFVVREFTYNEEELAQGKTEITKLATDKKKQFGPLVRWLKVNFSEAFTAWIHVKALRVFVESVLRYGLPVNFQAVLMHPNKKSVKRLREVLNQLYQHLDSSGGSGSKNTDSMDMPGMGFGQTDYYPYVFYKLDIEMVETAKN